MMSYLLITISEYWINENRKILKGVCLLLFMARMCRVYRCIKDAEGTAQMVKPDGEKVIVTACKEHMNKEYEYGKKR